jgi:ribosomal protein L34
MHTNIRSSSAKHKKQTGFMTRQKTKGGRKTNRRQRRRHGKI